MGMEIQGRATSAVVFAGELEATAERQIRAFLDHPAFEGLKVRIMPDVHAGAGAVIGFTSNLGPRIIPNVIGVDIGCGVASVCLGDATLDRADLPAFDQALRRTVPSGFEVRKRPLDRDALGRLFNDLGPQPRWRDCDAYLEDLAEACRRTGQDGQRVLRSIGTLGGGNHFVELDRSRASGLAWLTVHSGSRNFGLRIARHHQDAAVRACGRQGGLEYLEGDAAQAYVRDMQVAQVLALLNRRAMLAELLVHLPARTRSGLQGQPGNGWVESVHNYIDFGDRVVRKGAIRAHRDEAVVIPWNMRDGIVLGLGLGNDAWNRSAPHGAGRRMGRNEAKRTLRVADFVAQMRAAGVWSSCVDAETLDEAPDAYKPAAAVEAQLADTVQVLDRLAPLYNFKAGAE